MIRFLVLCPMAALVIFVVAFSVADFAMDFGWIAGALVATGGMYWAYRIGGALGRE